MTRIAVALAAAVVALSAVPSFADDDNCNSCKTQDGWQIVSAYKAPQPQRFFLQVKAEPRSAGVAYIAPRVPQEQISLNDSRDR